MAGLTIEPIPCLTDNYCYLVFDAETGDAWIVDPSEAEPPRKALERHGLRLRGILATHHHWDHVNGIGVLLDRYSRDGAVWVAGHAHDYGRIPNQSVFVEAPTGRFGPTPIELSGLRLTAAHIPGHTLGAIAWAIPARDGSPGDVFTGDTLFAAGCGRLFEGTPEQMHESLQTICALPETTRLWFGHEYTASNLKFAATVEPDNEAVGRLAQSIGDRTTPTTVAQERATNPFVRAKDAAQLGERRAAKDKFQ